MRLACEYCDRVTEMQNLEWRNGKFVCKDKDACDAAEDAAHKVRLVEMRRRQRGGEELTDAERQELAA